MSKHERILSVDFLRGLTVTGMILVNNPGSWQYVYPPLRHAAWHGCTPTDLVFPFFLFIVGLSINYSLGYFKDTNQVNGKLYLKIIKRSLILFGLGLFIAAFPFTELEGLRIPGVLQRIAIVFLICAVAFLKLSRKSQIVFTAILLLSYWIMMSFIPAPGVGLPNLDPGTNFAAWFDQLILSGHMWQYTKTWDPEGLLSTIPAIASGMIGVLAADWLKKEKEASLKVTWLFISGTALIISGLVWDLFFPINKSLWTSSYVLYTAGLAIHALALSYWFIDVMQFRKFVQPFIFFGANAITIYVGSELLAKTAGMVSLGTTSVKDTLYNAFNQSWLGSYNASLAFALLWVLLFLVIAMILYKRKIFIKV
ncbi:MAG: DUF5009 domain-containing protein [Cytophagaceae bacterium]|nr:DUF5009 domain-containing protein [Cytophagaceae bacterium]